MAWDFAPRAVFPAPNYPLSDLSLWKDITSTMRNFSGSISKPMSGAKDFAYKKGFNLEQGIGNAVILSGPTSYLWGDISGIS